MGNNNSGGNVRKSVSLPTSPESRRSSAIPHKGGSSIPLPGSALPSRRCPPDKVRPVAGSSRASSPALSMIPRGPPAPQISSPYQQNSQQKNSMLDKLKLFKSNDKPTPVSNGKRTSSSSGVSSARSERSDSSVSLEPSADVKPVRNTSRIKQTRPLKSSAASKGSPIANKKEVIVPKATTKIDVEKHANKVASLPSTKLTEPKVKVNSSNKVDVPKQSSNLPQNSTMPQSTSIPKPTAAVKGTTKIMRDEKSINIAGRSPSVGMSRENSQVSIQSTNKPVVALISPMKNERDQPLSESSHSTSTTGPNSSDSSVIYKPSSESSSEHSNLIYTKKELSKFITDHQQQPHQQNSNQYPIQNQNQNHHTHSTPVPNQQQKIQQPTNNEKIQNKLNNQHSIQHNIPKSKEGVSEEVSLNVQPMRPLFRGYCSTLTLPSRPRPTYQMMQPEGMGDYCEIALANGYLSDGDVLQNTPRESTDGYLSEGGSVLYARRLQTMPAHIPNGHCRTGLTVLTEQSARRGRLEDPPPAPGPRNSSRSRNGVQMQDTKHGQWKRYTDSPGVGSPPPPPGPAPPSPTSSKRERRGSPHNSKEKNNKVRGAPQSFGYVKRGASSNGLTNGTAMNESVAQVQVLQQGQSGKTVAVTAVPRTKVKVSGGTQTCSSDLQQVHKASPPQFKSYSLTGNAANQLSQSVRERLMMGSQSLPKGAGQDYGLILRQGRPKVSDGSLSDTQAIENVSPYAPWLRHR
ncbi:hypothetical protein WA026_010255 [Henosepilachna vigintioctopunctata]|uniref:Uncharacterized protein n=1 Tax=Henosepilachna vigintioctopunctata TaxID=420089 RepID=A0AAW1UHP1_9CUCU